MSSERIAFIGGGNMTMAIAGGLIDSGVDVDSLVIAEPFEEQRSRLVEQFEGATIVETNNEAAAGASTIVLATKPQVLPRVCRRLAKTVQSTRPLVISIAAGVRGSDIEEWLGGDLAVVRVMPNQPAMLGLGVSGVFCNSRTSSAQMRAAEKIVGATGEYVHVAAESDIDTVTAVSGSGPAYFFLLIDMLIKTGTALGLEPAACQTLAIETARGAAALALQEPASMDELIARVRSPGGTTAAALDSLEDNNVRAIFAEALTAARDRAVTLADDARSSKD